MGKKYTVVYTGTITNAGGNADLLEVLPATNKPVKLRKFKIANLTEVGDAQEENLSISIIRLGSAVTSGNGTAVTPTKPKFWYPAAGFGAECNGATVATTSGATEILEYLGWNERNSPMEWAWDEDEAPDFINGEALIVRMNNTPADDLDLNLTFVIEEEGH